MSDPKAEDGLMRSVLGKLYQVLTASGDAAPAAKDQFIAWCVPGAPFEEGDFDFAQSGLAGASAEDASRLLAQASELARLVNLIPDPSGVCDTSAHQAGFESAGALLWDVYRSALLSSEVAKGELSADQEAKLKRFRALLYTTKTDKNLLTDEEETLTTDSPVLRAYQEKMAAHMAALAEYNSKRISAMSADSAAAVQDWAMNAGSYRLKVKLAMDAWVTAGYKYQVEQMSAFIAQTSQRDLSLWKRELQEQLDRGKLTDIASGADFYSTGVIPGGFARSTSGWTRFHFSESMQAAYERRETNAWSVEGGADALLWKASVRAGSERSRTTESIDTKGFRMSCLLTQVILSRPWFSPELLTSGAFRFPEASGLRPLSDGGRPPSGQLVAYPTAAVFLRDLTADFAELHKTESTYASQISAGAEVGFGPFRLGGGYKRGSVEKKLSARVTESGLEVSGMQLIALKCALLPKSPDPSPSILSWT